MRELGHLNKWLQVQNFDKIEKADKFIERKVEVVKIDSQPKYAIDEILDKVEDGDLSILEELGISYTEMDTDTGYKKITFKYEDTRYTVNIMNPTRFNDKVGQTRDNIKTIKNDDGSYKIFEYDETGTLIKSTEYDENGQITEIREYNADGYKAYYFNNGIKTTEVNIDKQGRPYYQLDFDENGNVLRIWNTDWKDDGSLVGTCKTQDGQMISLDITDSQGRGIYAERYENGKLNEIIETDYLEDGTSRQIHKNPNGNITWIIYWNNDSNSGVNKSAYKDDTNFLDELKNLVKDYKYQLNDILSQIRSLVAPTPPKTIDFKRTTDGKIDENAYNDAMRQYNEQLLAYHTKINELNNKAAELQDKLQQLNKQISELEFEAKINNVENSLNYLKNIPNQNNDIIALLETTLKNIKQNFTELSSRKLELQKEIQNIYNQILSLHVPTPPSTSNFVKPDGSIDEKAYESAYKDYEYQKYEYDKKINELNFEASKLQNELAKTDMELQKQTNEFNQLEKNIDAIKTVQDLIDNIADKDDNKNLISKLNEMLNEIYNNIKNQEDLRQNMDVLYDTFISENVPIPPSVNDYRKPDGNIDDDAYSKAYDEYEKAMKEYDDKIKQYNTSSSIASNELKNLTNKIYVIVFSAMVSVIENNITQLRQAGKTTQANELEAQLNNIKKEYNLIQSQKKLLLSRENMLLNRLNRITTPTPPSMNDYQTENGNIDEKAYTEAMNNYDKQMNKFDRIVTTIQKQLDNISEKLMDLDNMMAKLQEKLSDLV